MPALDNPQHERFAQELAKGANATDAYERAGYRRHDSNAARLSGNDRVRARVAELASAAADKAVLTKSWVIERLMRNAERAAQAEPVLDAEGAPTGEFKFDGNVVNRALELLGKDLGMFVDRTENVTTIRDITDQPLSDAEWAERHVTQH